MNDDDDRTRIITPAAKSTSDDADDAPTRMFTGSPQTSNQSNNQDDDDNRTRVFTGIDDDQPPSPSEAHDLAVGWIVVVKGFGKGCTKEVFYGMNSLGRSEDERIALNFGDESISRSAHAYIVFDEKQNEFYIQHGGKSNLVRLNDAPVLSPLPLKQGDLIEIGATTLMFVPLCGPDFNWEEAGS